MMDTCCTSSKVSPFDLTPQSESLPPIPQLGGNRPGMRVSIQEPNQVALPNG